MRKNIVNLSRSGHQLVYDVGTNQAAIIKYKFLIGKIRKQKHGWGMGNL